MRLIDTRDYTENKYIQHFSLPCVANLLCIPNFYVYKQNVRQYTYETQINNIDYVVIAKLIDINTFEIRVYKSNVLIYEFIDKQKDLLLVYNSISKKFLVVTDNSKLIDMDLQTYDSIKSGMLNLYII